jgi:hypothetical protein
MADARDVTMAVAAALSEISVTGVLEVTIGRERLVQWLGSPTGDDVRFIVSVLPLQADDLLDGSAS